MMQIDQLEELGKCSHSCEAFYLRPDNGWADDQVRRNNSAQYFSYPDYPFTRLRQESPEKYESYVALVLGEWTKDSY